VSFKVKMPKSMKNNLKTKSPFPSMQQNPHPPFRVSRLSLWALSAALVLLTFPEIDPTFGISIDGPLAWLYNHLYANERTTLQGMTFPHGPLDFIYSPLPIGNNLELALLANTFLRWLFAWSGLRLAQVLGGQGRFWAAFLLLAILLELNGIDVLLTATVGHLLLLALLQAGRAQERNALLAIALTAVGLCIKLAIGVPAAMMVLGWLCWRYVDAPLLFNRKKAYPVNAKRFTVAWLPLLGGLALLPTCIALVWWGVFGNLKGLDTFLQSIFYLSVGNSSAVCHYPANNWWLLGTFLLIFFAWGRSTQRVGAAWWVLLLPAFGFWKYGFSREDIWHIHTTFRFFVWAFAMLLLMATRIRPLEVLSAAVALSAFYMNMRVAEGWSHFAIQPIGLNNVYEWTFRFKANKEAAMARCTSNIRAHLLPDSVRQRIGDRGVDCYPFDYSWVAANNLRLQPRPVPQSYAAYHPWLAELDRQFFSGPQAPPFIIFHLKRYSEGGELEGLDGRHILHDEPLALLAMLNRYRVVMRHPEFLLLEKTDQHYLGSPVAISGSPTDWKEQAGQHGLIVWENSLKKTWWAALKSALYKAPAMWADVHLGLLQHRVKLVPELFNQGVVMAPWLTKVSTEQAGPNLPDSIAINILHETGWRVTKPPSAKWYPLHPDAGWPAVQSEQRATLLVEGRVDSLMQVAPQGFSGGWMYRLEQPLSDSLSGYIAVSADIASAQNQYAQLVVTHAEQADVLYAPMNHGAYGFNMNQFWPVSLCVPLPRQRPLPLKVYVWNTSDAPASVRNLRVRVMYR
jgi:hypothetical protein